eukprot:1142048-Pelagomonas_calceolata.AAC.2
MGDCCSEWNFEVKLDQLSALAVYGLMAANKVGKEAMGKCGSELGQQCCNHQIGKGDNGGYNAVNLAEEACAFLLQRVPACVCDAALNAPPLNLHSTEESVHDDSQQGWQGFNGNVCDDAYAASWALCQLIFCLMAASKDDKDSMYKPFIIHAQLDGLCAN